MAEEGTVIPGEDEGYDASPQRVEEAQATKARTLGWKPLEEFKGDPGEWVDAKEFVGRQSLFDKIKSLKDELRSQRQSFDTDMQQIKGYVQQMSKVEYDKAVRQIKQERRAAVEERDVEAVEQFDEQLKQVEQARINMPDPKAQQTQRMAQEVQEQFTAWKDKNSWYQEDHELRQEADSLGTGYGAKNPNKSPADVMDYVERTIKKLYPERFGRKPVEEKKAAAVEGGGPSHNVASGRKTNANTLSESELTADQSKIMNTLIKRGVVTKEQYLAQMADALTGNHKDFAAYQPKAK